MHGDYRVLESGKLDGYQIKGGGMRHLTSEWSVFANACYVSKVPIYDAVIEDARGVVNEDPRNETFVSFEGGVRYRSAGRGLSFDLNGYHTTWRDRTYNLFVPNIVQWLSAAGAQGRRRGGVPRHPAHDQRGLRAGVLS